jgi:hypothetical protein
VINIKRDLFQEWLLAEKLSQDEFKIEIDESLKLKAIETGKIIDLKEELKGKLTTGVPEKKSGKTVLAPDNTVISKPSRAYEEDKEGSSPKLSNKDDDANKSRYSRSPYKSRYSSRYERKRDRDNNKYDSRYGYSDEDRKRRRYHRSDRKRRYDRRSGEESNQSQSSSNSDKENYRNRKYKYSQRKS